ncbi:hypothetical protein ACTXHA_37850 [Burkholderia cenocepacia]
MSNETSPPLESVQPASADLVARELREGFDNERRFSVAVLALRRSLVAQRELHCALEGELIELAARMASKIVYTNAR